MKCIIVGGYKGSFYPFNYNPNEDYIIAADKGYEFLKEYNYSINLVVGDFDSLGYDPEFINQINLPVIKDITDLHAAIEEGIKKGYKTFEIYGCLGGRIEHSIAAIQEAYNYKLLGNDIILHGTNNQTLLLVKNSKIELEKENGFISVFSLSEVSNGVTIKGLKYEVDNISITNKFPLGVSNEFINKKATIQVNDGCLLIVY